MSTQKKNLELDEILIEGDLHDKFTEETKAQEAFCTEHFKEIIGLIDLQEKNIIKQIADIAESMIIETNKKEQFYKDELDKLRTLEQFDLEAEKARVLDEFRQINLSLDNANQIKDEYEKKVQDVKDTLNKLNDLKAQVKLAKFEPNLKFKFSVKDFGRLTFFDGKQQIACCVDNTIQIWDLEKGESVKAFQGHTDLVTSLVKISSDKMASGSWDKSIKIWSIETGDCLRTIATEKKVLSLEVLSESTIISADNDIHIWNIDDGTCIFTLSEHKGDIRGLKLLSKQVLASCSQDKTIKLWNLDECVCLKTFEEHTDEVNCLQKLENGNLVSGSCDGTIKVWNTENGKCLETLNGHDKSVLGLDLTSSGDQLISCSADKTIKIWSLETNQCIRTLQGHDNEVRCVKSYTNDMIVSGSMDNTIKIWDKDSDDCITTLQGQHEKMCDLKLI
jgi:WD40 repeat protein